ncbi:MAG TPA: pilus assembly protein N-terminal domain-containing protein [Candidatus Baltobacteraceae bacterium]
MPRALAALAIVLAAFFATARAQQSPPPVPGPTYSPFPTPPPSGTPLPNAVPATPGAVPETLPSPSATPTSTPTAPPIVVSPAALQVPVGTSQRISVGSALAPIAASVHNPALADVAVDQSSQTVTVTGKTPGATVVTVSDARGLTRDVGITVAYYAGSIAPRIAVQLTGDPASEAFVRDEVATSVRHVAQPRPGAQVVVGPDDVPFHGTLAQDDVASFDVPLLLQGTNYIEVDGTTHVDVQNVAVPRISPDSLMVSDYPERLTENGTLFASDLHHEKPSRFLYFHYNPPGQPERRIVLRAENTSSEPAIVQFISGSGGPGPNEMQVGHDATKAFLTAAVENQGRLVAISGNTSVNLAEQDLPPGDIVCNLLQLRVLSGSDVKLTLFAQDAGDSPYVALTNTDLLEDTHKHARGVYPIPEFHYATQWNVNGEYLELPIGQIPLPNDLQGEALAGDYGVLQSFVVTVQNPTTSPQAIAIYENPRGGRATGTYLIDGVLVQSHQVPPFSRYKVRQYVVPARGFVRITIVTTPEAGSSYPLRLVLAPDDGSVAPGGPGSPIY